MSTYIYSRWKNNPDDCAAEYYSELDSLRYETRKVEIFKDGRLSYASKRQSTGETELGVVPVPSIAEIMAQAEFDIKTISQQEFEAVWQKATSWAFSI